LYEFSLARAKASDREREPQLQERHWPEVRQRLLNDDPIIAALDEETLATGFEKALALPASQQIPAVMKLAGTLGAAATPKTMASAVIAGSKIGSLDARREWVEAKPDRFTASTDPAMVFARDLLPTIIDLRQRTRILNENLLRNRSAFARALTAMASMTGAQMYYDANFTLRVTYGRVAGYTSRGTRIPFTTRFGDMFTLAASRGNQGDFALPAQLEAWRKRIGDATFQKTYASLPVDLVSTNDITGGNSGSSLLNRSLGIVGLIFDGNEEAMAGDWTYSEAAGRALSTDIRFALTVARDVHHAGWIVDELLK
jgi:hypothetical protein